MTKIDKRKQGPRRPKVRAGRAPRSDGPRTTLRVPRALMEAANELADELKVSRNDALLRLATRGAELYANEQAIAERREARWAAVVPGRIGADKTAFPSPDEAREAVLAARGESQSRSSAQS